MMKARISQEFEDAIYDYIYLELMMDALEKKLANGLNVETVIKTVSPVHIKVKSFLRKNQIRVDDVKVDSDSEFVTYPFYIKVDGGYKEGYQRFWRAAMVMQLNKRFNQMRKGERFVVGTYD